MSILQTPSTSSPVTVCRKIFVGATILNPFPADGSSERLPFFCVASRPPRQLPQGACRPETHLSKRTSRAEVGLLGSQTIGRVGRGPTRDLLQLSKLTAVSNGAQNRDPCKSSLIDIYSQRAPNQFQGIFGPPGPPFWISTIPPHHLSPS